ncbi:unnamed protein product [Sphagnum balticum]
MTTTLAHTSGHILKIIHSALSSVQREQIKRLPECKDQNCKHYAEGGEVEADAKPAESTAEQKPKTEDTARKATGPWRYCQKCHNTHGACTCYDDGGTVAPDSQPAPTSGPAIDPDKAKKFMKGFQGATGFYSGGVTAQNPPPEDSDEEDDSSDPSSSEGDSSSGHSAHGNHVTINLQPLRCNRKQLKHYPFSLAPLQPRI